MGIQILNKDVSVISRVVNVAKANIGSIFGKTGWNGGGGGGGPATQGPNFPGTAVDREYGDSPWYDVDNIKSDNGQYAYNEIGFGQASTNFLSAENFGFSIPTGATINGIEVSFQAYGSNPLGNIAYIELWKGVYPTSGNSLGSKFPNDTIETEAIFTYGGAADKWDGTPTVTDINSSTFSVVMIFDKSTPKGTYTINVDYVTCKVYYTT